VAFTKLQAEMVTKDVYGKPKTLCLRFEEHLQWSGLCTFGILSSGD
jgi:hypothetical protein